MKLIYKLSTIQIKHFATLVLFIFLFAFCNSDKPINVESICGETPNNFVEIDIEKNPNYVFVPDSNFLKIKNK